MQLMVVSPCGGVQASIMTFMVSKGAFDTIPDCAVFHRHPL